MAREWQPWETERSGNKLNTYVLDNLLFFFKAPPHGMQDLSPPVRDRTRALCVGSTQS